jgi:hypothetical protein
MGQVPPVASGVITDDRPQCRPGGRSAEGAQELDMQRFMIEREIPGASTLTPETWPGSPRPRNDVVAGLDVPYRWVTGYVAGDKVYCVHEAEDAGAILEHARRGGFPANTVSVVANEFGPQTAAP